MPRAALTYAGDSGRVGPGAGAVVRGSGSVVLWTTAPVSSVCCEAALERPSVDCERGRGRGERGVDVAAVHAGGVSRRGPVVSRKTPGRCERLLDGSDT